MGVQSPTLILLLAAALAAPLPALASGSKVSSPLQLAKQAERLKAGEWVWAGKIAPTGPGLRRSRFTIGAIVLENRF